MESSLIYLVKLNHLNHLDVSINDFSYSKIPKFLGYMSQLRYLNLSYDNIHGKVPPELGNLTNLQVLDLSIYNPYLLVVNRFKDPDLFVQNLKWVSSLEQLSLLGLSGVNLSQAHDWIGSLMGPLPFLTALDLSGCSLTNSHQIHIPPFIQNLTSFKYLDLSYNHFDSKIPLWLGEIKSLEGLELGFNTFTGIEGRDIWNLVRNLCNLKYLDVSYNKLQVKLLEFRENISSICTHFNLEWLDLSDNSFISGSIPTWLGEEFQSLKYLSLRNNNISGKIPTSLGMLSALEVLSISYNSLEAAVLSETHFANLSSLTYLSMYESFLTLKLPSSWVPPFQLTDFLASTCKINSQLPQWLKTQKHLYNLDLSNAGIQGVLPKWFHNLQSLSDVDISNNNITGCPNFPINFNKLTLSHNSLSCLFMPSASHRNKVYYHADAIDLSYNSISGQLPEHLYHIMPSLTSLVLSNNLMNGSIPKSICHFASCTALDLQKNRLSGKNPGCLGNLSSLQFISLSSNKLLGNISCLNSLNLSYLHLNDNMLSGEIPSCLTNLSSLSVLDVGENNLSGEIPTLMVPELQILRLRNNKLKGSIPNQLCSLSNLQILDLGHNYLTGTIPYCLSSLTRMSINLAFGMLGHDEKANEVIQGYEREYTTNLGLLVNIDLSYNKLVGSIPIEITNLSGLLSLNLSYNHLSRQIPEDIGGLNGLESLDLSRNQLCGSIPTSLGSIFRLASLDLSYNNLSGQISSGYQLQTLNDPSIYKGNPYLCGDPLPKKCKDSPNNGSGGKGSQDEDSEDKRETMWFYLVVISGFATGFWGVVGTLFLKKSWRHAFFRRVEDVHDWMYVAIAVRMAKLRND